MCRCTSQRGGLTASLTKHTEGRNTTAWENSDSNDPFFWPQVAEELQSEILLVILAQKYSKGPIFGQIKGKSYRPTEKVCAMLNNPTISMVIKPPAEGR